MKVEPSRMGSALLLFAYWGGGGDQCSYKRNPTGLFALSACKDT